MFIIAGPCVVESKSMLMNIAKVLVNICNNLEFELIFKASYKKANRTNIDSFTGIGDAKALGFLKDVSNKFNIKVLTDVHSPEEAEVPVIQVKFVGNFGKLRYDAPVIVEVAVVAVYVGGISAVIDTDKVFIAFLNTPGSAC